MFDVVVVGGGHAGCEAAAAAARAGARVVLVTMASSTIGAMSCNPAIGGVGKGHIVREVDALDGLIARAADQAAIHYRMLNRSKGKAVHGPRVQADRRRYAAAIQGLLEQSGVAIHEGKVGRLTVDGTVVRGIELTDGRLISAPSTVIATGTFLGARMFRGDEVIPGGRIGEASSERLGEQLRAMNLPIGRLKTGTPPRIDGWTVAWEKLDRQESDREHWTMSPMSSSRILPQLACGVTRTNPRTHSIIRDGFGSSPLRSGAISGAGPRYCPSIEDKVDRFGDRDGHQIFLEPEGLDTSTIYPNGISTSLPVATQQQFLRSIVGLEAARIVTPGYAVEYGFVDPRVLDRRLAVEGFKGLFLAGQINGTTGYEEAAGQGLVAGLNAASAALGAAPIIFEREDSYIGVMIDDLTLQGVTEPYRMLTARAEHRLHLRTDNAGSRLNGLAKAANCIGPERVAHYDGQSTLRSAVRRLLEQNVSSETLGDFSIDVDATLASRPLTEWAAHPDVADRVERLLPPALQGTLAAAEVIEDVRYAPYVERQRRDADNVTSGRRVRLSADLNYQTIAGLSVEMAEKLGRARPATLEEAQRIRGVTPAALSAVLVAQKRKAA